MPSHFYPSSHATFQKCERRSYFADQYQILRDWSWPLIFGTAVHEVLGAYDGVWHQGVEARIAAGTEKALEISAEWPSWRFDNVYNPWQLCRIPVWYAEHFGEDSMCQPVGDAEIEIPHHIMHGLPYGGRIDGVVKAMGQHYIRDRKSTGGELGDNFFSRFSPDLQFSAYIFLGRKAWPHLKIAGVLCEGIKLGGGYVDFYRVPIIRSDEEIIEFEKSAMRDAKRRVELEGQPMEEWFKSEASCFGCPFRPICAAPTEKRKIYKIISRDGDGR